MLKKHTRGGKEFNPETLALGYGYDPKLSEGAVKPPVFMTSTFEFDNARQGKRFFELAYGLCKHDVGEEDGLIYSRINNPNLQIFEERFAAWDKAELAATFSSGMAAISTTMLALLRPGDVIVSAAPVYGGTHYLFEHVLPAYDIRTKFVPAGDGAIDAMRAYCEGEGKGKVRLLFMETPANPSLVHTDIAGASKLARALSKKWGKKVVTVVDNTLLGPLFQRPAELGADLVIYSATKFIGGHSDLVAGVVTGSKEHMQPILLNRTVLGTMTSPFYGWLLLRSLETLSIRMRRQAKNASALARLMAEHPCVRSVTYPGLLQKGDPQLALYSRQCTGPGSMITFEIDGGEEEAFRVLDSFEICRLAVSLGGTETLVEHPATMTHADVPPADLANQGVGPGVIRISVGIEHLSDLKRDLRHALDVLR